MGLELRISEADPFLRTGITLPVSSNLKSLPVRNDKFIVRRFKISGRIFYQKDGYSIQFKGLLLVIFNRIEKLIICKGI